MATPMGPPVLPGYSLRVQLFSPLAHALGDKPIRCFRVVTQPEATIREFCQEASRIHEINYGEPLAIKKVQDDQEFDITQSEILGHLFTNTATVRVIQATAHPSVRDSVPPTSALRFDPSITRKREREGSVRPNGVSPSSTWKPNKRQRVSELDPDEPLPSRENDTERRTGRIPEVKVIPDSQDEGSSPRQHNPSRQVRQEPAIPETPSPSPPPELQHSPHLANGSADQRRIKTETQSQNDAPNHIAEIQNSSPLGQASERALSNGSQRAKSSSYHISRPTERGTSVSTAATSPFSVDQQTPMQNGLTSASKRTRINPSPKPRSNANEETIYDSIVSEDEGAAVIRKKKSSLKMRNSPNNGLPGIDWANNKFNTPPNGTRRPSRSRDDSSAGELPLTPNSKEREKRQQEKHEANEVKRARKAAAEAAEQRKLEAEEARQAEEARVAEEERAKREEQERLEVEEFQREEAKRQAVIAKAARLQKERQEREKKEAEEQRRLEEERLAKEKAESERLAKNAEAEAKRLREEEERERERQAEEVERKRQEEEKKERERRAAQEAMKKKSASPEEQRQRHSSSPILPRGTPSSTSKPQSSTPYIPNGRKSALKSSLSSQVLPSSSPSSPEVSRGVGIEAQMPLPSKLNRKVSFDLHERKETPIKPPTRIVPPPKSTTPKASSSTLVTQASKDSTPTALQQGSVPPVKQSRTPIPVPPTLKRSSLERSITPVGRAAIVPPPKEPSPLANITKIPPPARSSSQKSERPIEPPVKVKPETIIIDSSSDSEEDIPAVASPAKLTRSPSLSSKPALPTTVAAKPEQSDDEDEEEIDEDGTQSHNSSIRDSRSPVIYSKHIETESVPALRLPSPQSESSSEKEDGDSKSSKSDSEDSEDDDEPTPKPKSKEVGMKDDEEQESSDEEASDSESKAQDVEMKDSEEEGGSEESESESEDEGTEVQVPKSSPPTLHAPKLAKVSAPKPSQTNNSKASTTPEEMSIQDEIDQQLTSSVYEVRSTANSSAVPSSSAIRPPPAFNVGPSLSKMAASKQLYGSSAAKPSTPARSSQPAKVDLDEESDSESEEESNEESTSSDKDDKPSKPMATVVAKKSQSKATYSDDSSDEDSESEDEQTKERKGLLAKIAAVANGDSQVSIPSPKAYRTVTQEVKKYGKKGEKKIDKHVTGQKFREPGLY